jgi:hypothetical protein
MRSFSTNPISWPRKDSNRNQSAREIVCEFAFYDSVKSSCSIAGSAAEKRNGKEHG